MATPGPVGFHGDVNIQEVGGTVVVGSLPVTVVGGVSGTEFAEDSPHTTGDLGTQILAVRNDTPGSLVDTDGDYGSLQLDSAGALRIGGSVQVIGEVSLGATRIENTVAGSGFVVFPQGTIRDDALDTLGVADGDWTTMRVNSVGALWTAIDGTVTVNGAVSIASAVVLSGTRQEGTAVSANTPDVFPAGVERDDALTTLSDPEGDWVHPRVNSVGALWTAVDGTVTVVQSAHDSLQVNANLQVNNIDVAGGNPVPVSDGGGTLSVDGSVTVLSIASFVDLTAQAVEDVAVPAAPTLLPPAVERDDTLGTITPVDGDWTHLRSNDRGALWTKHDGEVTVTQAVHGSLQANVTLQLQDTDIVAGAGLAVTRAARIPVQVYGLAGLPILTYNISSVAETIGNSITDPSALTAAGVNTGMGGQTGTGGALRTGPDRDTIVNLFDAQVLDDSPTSANSSLVDVSNARWAVIYIDLAEAGNPTDIRLIAQFSNDGGTTWFDYAVDQWVDLRYVDTQMPLTEIIPLNYVIGTDFRLRAVATGTTVSDTFTLTADIEVIS